jgi:hypothetical protein
MIHVLVRKADRLVSRYLFQAWFQMVVQLVVVLEPHQ